ncbi:hypothetical protein H8356DRAFT_1682240 [Neocallimastix lanati (nom. inval.)]|nr:hypothetical protein H8356DRAFT_1682240 [Neocallimastix sp. JGI-2020a]
MDDFLVEDSYCSWHTCIEDNQNSKSNNDNNVKNEKIIIDDTDADSIKEFEKIIDQSEAFNKLKEKNSNSDFLRSSISGNAIKNERRTSPSFLPSLLKPEYINNSEQVNKTQQNINLVNKNKLSNTYVETTQGKIPIHTANYENDSNILRIPNLSILDKTSSATLVDYQDDEYNVTIPGGNLSIFEERSKIKSEDNQILQPNKDNDEGDNAHKDDIKETLKDTKSNIKDDIKETLKDTKSNIKDDINDVKKNTTESLKNTKENNLETTEKVENSGTIGRLFGYFKGFGKSEVSFEDNKEKINENGKEDQINVKKDPQKLNIPKIYGTESSAVTIVGGYDYYVEEEEDDDDDDDDDEFVNAYDESINEINLNNNNDKSNNSNSIVNSPINNNNNSNKNDIKTVVSDNANYNNNDNNTINNNYANDPQEVVVEEIIIIQNPDGTQTTTKKVTTYITKDEKDFNKQLKAIMTNKEVDAIVKNEVIISENTEKVVKDTKPLPAIPVITNHKSDYNIKDDNIISKKNNNINDSISNNMNENANNIIIDDSININRNNIVEPVTHNDTVHQTVLMDINNSSNTIVPTKHHEDNDNENDENQIISISSNDSDEYQDALNSSQSNINLSNIQFPSIKNSTIQSNGEDTIRSRKHGKLTKKSSSTTINGRPVSSVELVPINKITNNNTQSEILNDNIADKSEQPISKKKPKKKKWYKRIFKFSICRRKNDY